MLTKKNIENTIYLSLAAQFITTIVSLDGVKYKLKSPPASLKQDPVEVITGVLENKLSIIGIPKPSKMDSKSARNSIFASPLFRTCFAFEFGAIFGSSEPEKH